MWYVRITYATPDKDASHLVGPTDRLMAEMLLLSMADGYTFPDCGWVAVKRARIVPASPPDLFATLDAEFGFTLDPCCKPSTAKCARYFTEDDDGLAHSWAGEVVFMNPPYGREIYDWTAKAVREAQTGATVVGLLPASTDSEWWHRDVLGSGAEIRYLRGRVRFLQGERWVSGMFPSVVVVWRPS